MREGTLKSHRQKPHRPLSKDNLSAVLGEGYPGPCGTAAASLTRSCTLREQHLQFDHPLYKSQPPASLIRVFVAHKHLLSPICARGQRSVMAFHSLVAHKVEKAVEVFLHKMNTNMHSTCISGAALRLTRRCLLEEQYFMRIFTVPLVLWGNKTVGACSSLIVHNHLEDRAASTAGAGACWSKCLH